jgi:hypothetical protein
MKYISILCLTILLLAPVDVAIGSEALVTNNISNSQVNQYIIIKCGNDECLAWLKENKQLFLNNDVEPPIVDSSEVKDGGEMTTVVQIATVEEKAIATSANIQVTETKKQIINARDLRINEIMAAPVSGQTEWVEVFNTLNLTVDLSGFKLTEGAGKVTLLSGVLFAGGYAVFEKSSLNNDGDKIQLIDDIGQLIDEVSYGNWDDGNISDNAPVSTSGHAIILVDNVYKETEIPTPNQKNIFQLTVEVPKTTAVETVKTIEPIIAPIKPIETVAIKEPIAEIKKSEPAVAEISVVKFQFSDQVRVNEILADPAGSDDFEWIELYNAGDVDVDLFGWTLDDSEGGSQPYKIDGQTIIKAKEYLVFKREETGLALNNSTDAARLLDPNGIISSEIVYANTKENVSLAFFVEGYQETSILTPGAENKKTALQLAQFELKETTAAIKSASSSSNQKNKSASIGLVDIKKIKELTLKTKVKIRGQVVVLPGVFAKTQMYLAGVNDEDSNGKNSGIQVYFSKADWPKLLLGDIVELTGVVSESNQERRLLLQNKDNLKVVDHIENENLFFISSIESIEENESVLVRMAGELVEIKQNNLVFSDGQGEFKVYLKKGAAIDVSKFKLGDKVELTGIVSGYDDNYRLFPRGQNDLKNLSWQEKKPFLGKEAGNSEVQVGRFQNKVAYGLGFGFIIVLAVNMYLFRQRLFEVAIKLWSLLLLKSKFIK